MKPLGYNRGENPYSVAQDFILKHQLNQNYLEDIAKFIIKNAPESITGTFSRPTNSKPSTTSSSPSKVVSAGTLTQSNSKFFPQIKPLLFESTKPAQFDGPLGKIKQFNEQFTGTENCLNPKDLSLLETTVSKLKQTSHYHATEFSTEECSVAAKLGQWPVQCLWPVLDFYRLFVLHPEGAKFTFSSGTFQKLLNSPKRMTDTNESGEASHNNLLLLKLIANCFMFESSKSNIIKSEEAVLDTISDIIEQANKSSLLALATALLNFAVSYLRTPTEKGIPQLLSIINQALQHKDNDAEIQLRLLVALGTVIYSNKQYQQLANDLGIKESVQTMKALSDNVQLCAKDILALFT